MPGLGPEMGLQYRCTGTHGGTMLPECRSGLEFLLAVFRIAEAASPSPNVRDER